MNIQRTAYAYGMATVLLWSTVASAFKISLRHVDYFQLLCVSTLVSALTLLLALATQGKLKTLRDLSRKDLQRSALLGLLNPLLYYLILFKAYDLLPAQEAQPLNYTWAITLALLSIPFLGQRITGRDFLAMGVSYLGVLTICTRGDVLGLSFADPLGAGLALGSTVIWAIYWIFNTRDTMDPVLRLFLNFAFGCIYILPVTWLFSDPLTVNLPGLLSSAYVGVFEMGVTFILWLKALKLSQTTAQVANLIYFSPCLSLLFIRVFVGETILPSTITGLVLIILGNVIQKKIKT
ncbi:MAG TPA: DMT family transporter [Desulfonatronum sp.]|nr:DMT family transporter [Desulfonatronum sp.]